MPRRAPTGANGRRTYSRASREEASPGSRDRSLKQGLSMMRTMLVAAVTLTAPIFHGRCAQSAESAGSIDLTRAVVVVPGDASTREKKAVGMLVDEVHKRSQIRWQIAAAWPKADGLPIVAVGRDAYLQRDFPVTKSWLARQPAAPGAEGYRIQTPENGRVLVAGNDERGVLFGAGRLLRELRMSRGKILLPAGFHEASAPQTALRGHQLGYRQKTNSY